MTPEQIALVESTNAAVSRDPAVAHRFYERLFRERPDLRPLFPADTSELEQKFVDTLAELVTCIRNLGGFETRARALGALHRSAFGVRAQHYALVREPLLWAVLGDDPKPELEAAWRAAYDLVAEAMMSGASAPTV